MGARAQEAPAAGIAITRKSVRCRELKDRMLLGGCVVVALVDMTRLAGHSAPAAAALGPMKIGLSARSYSSASYTGAAPPRRQTAVLTAALAWRSPAVRDRQGGLRPQQHQRPASLLQCITTLGVRLSAYLPTDSSHAWQRTGDCSQATTSSSAGMTPSRIDS